MDREEIGEKEEEQPRSANQGNEQEEDMASEEIRSNRPEEEDKEEERQEKKRKTEEQKGKEPGSHKMKENERTKDTRKVICASDQGDEQETTSETEEKKREKRKQSEGEIGLTKRKKAKRNQATHESTPSVSVSPECFKPANKTRTIKIIPVTQISGATTVISATPVMGICSEKYQNTSQMSAEQLNAGEILSDRLKKLKKSSVCKICEIGHVTERIGEKRLIRKVLDGTPIDFKGMKVKEILEKMELKCFKDSRICKRCFDSLCDVYSKSMFLSQACKRLHLLLESTKSKLGKALKDLTKKALRGKKLKSSTQKAKSRQKQTSNKQTLPKTSKVLNPPKVTYMYSKGIGCVGYVQNSKSAQKQTSNEQTSNEQTIPKTSKVLNPPKVKYMYSKGKGSVGYVQNSKRAQRSNPSQVGAVNSVPAKPTKTKMLCSTNYFSCPALDESICTSTSCSLCDREFGGEDKGTKLGNPPGKEKVLVMDMLQLIGVPVTAEQYAFGTVCLFCRNAVWVVFNGLKRLTRAKEYFHSSLRSSRNKHIRPFMKNLKTYFPPVLHSQLHHYPETCEVPAPESTPTKVSPAMDVNAQGAWGKTTQAQAAQTAQAQATTAMDPAAEGAQTKITQAKKFQLKIILTKAKPMQTASGQIKPTETTVTQTSTEPVKHVAGKATSAKIIKSLENCQFCHRIPSHKWSQYKKMNKSQTLMSMLIDLGWKSSTKLKGDISLCMYCVRLLTGLGTTSRDLASLMEMLQTRLKLSKLPLQNVWHRLEKMPCIRSAIDSARKLKLYCSKPSECDTQKGKTQGKTEVNTDHTYTRTTPAASPDKEHSSSSTTENLECCSPSSSEEWKQCGICQAVVTDFVQKEAVQALWTSLRQIKPSKRELALLDNVCSRCFVDIRRLEHLTESTLTVLIELHLIASPFETIGKPVCKHLEEVLETAYQEMKHAREKGDKRDANQEMEDSDSNAKEKMDKTDANRPKLSKKRVPKRPTVAATTASFIAAMNYRFESFFVKTYAQSAAFRNQLHKFIMKLFKKEIKLLMSPGSIWFNNCKSSMKAGAFEKCGVFDWKAALEETQKKCPLLFGVMTAATVEKGKFLKIEGVKEMDDSKVATLGIIFSLLLHLTKKSPISYYTVVQQMLGMELWLNGCSKRLQDRLSKIGLSLPPLMVTDKVRAYVTQDEKHVREKIKCVEEAVISQATDEIECSKHLPKALGNGSTTKEDDKGDGDAEDSVMDRPIQNQTMVNLQRKHESIQDKRFSYTLAFGEITPVTIFYLTGQSKHVPSKSMRTMKEDNRGLFTQACMVLDRIPTMHRSTRAQLPPTQARYIVSQLIPTKANETALWKEYAVMVERILTRRMPFFQACADDVDKHIPHQFQAESSAKSIVFPLGMTQNSPTCKVEDVADALEALQEKYVPRIPVQTGANQPMRAESSNEPDQGSSDQTELVPIVIGVSPATAKKAKNAVGSRSTGKSQSERLEGLHMHVGEWEKHAVYVEESYRLLYDINSSHSPGTLANIKAWHMSDLFNFLQSTDRTTELLRFATEAYVIAAACSIMDISDPSVEDKDPARNTHPDRFKKAKNKTLSGLANSVVQLVFNPPEKKDVFCVCRTEVDDGVMVRCDNERCKKGTWFHLACLGLEAKDLPEGDWFCSEDCMQKDDGDDEYTSTCDHIFEYSRALMYRGLGEMVRDDAMCENDGNRMFMHWKYDMMDFHQCERAEIFEQGIDLLASMLPASSRMAHQLKWNRTVNPTGGPGQNLPLDRYMEKVHADVEEAIRNSCGVVSQSSAKCFSYSKTIVLRKDIEDGIDKLFRRDKEPTKKENTVLEMAKKLLDSKCLNVIPGRSHEEFCGFRAQTHAKEVQQEYRDELEVRIQQWNERHSS